jgi:hypothetical protein
MKETNSVLWHRFGPRLEMTKRGGDPRYQYVLNIQDMNPTRNFNWCFSRWTMIRSGLWFIRRAIFSRQSS